MYKFTSYQDYLTRVVEDWELGFVNDLEAEGLLGIYGVEEACTVYRPLSEIEYHTYLQEKNNRAGNAIL